MVADEGAGVEVAAAAWTWVGVRVEGTCVALVGVAGAIPGVGVAAAPQAASTTSNSTAVAAPTALPDITNFIVNNSHRGLIRAHFTRHISVRRRT